MIIHRIQPQSNAERQRAFRERNPGYSNRYRLKITREQIQASIAATVAAAAAETELRRRSELEQPRIEFASA